METAFSLAPRGCAVCPSKSGLLRCGGCLVVHYCGKEHQVGHRKEHKAACASIKKTREALQHEEATLRANPGDMLTPADVFNTSVGRFWGIIGTRDYMRARFAAADALLKINNVDAVKAALNHLTDMLLLCRSDNLGVRDIVPFLMLRLGREQECYDFLKWWATAARDTKYDWNNIDAPYLNVCNADPFEDVEIFCGGLDLAHLVAITLLKTRLFLDLSAYESELSFDERIPSPDQLSRPIGKLAQAKVQSMDAYDLSSVVKLVDGQYRRLCNIVHDRNPHFWELVRQREDKATPTAAYSPGSTEEAELVFYRSGRAWNESEDADAMIDAETSKYTTIYRSPPDIGGSLEVSATGGDVGPREILMLCLEKQRHHEGLLDDVHKGLISRLASKIPVQRETSTEGALAKLSQRPPPFVILVADAAIARQIKVWERVIDHLRAGATVILGGLFSTMASPAEIDRMFTMIGLPWKICTYVRETVKLSSKILGSASITLESAIDSLGSASAALLPRTYSQKAVFLQNVSESARVYVADNDATGTAVAFAKVGKGRLGYIGDVNGEEASEAVVVAMCGL